MNETSMNPGSGSSGSLVGSIIVVIILIIGAIYLFSSKSSAPVIPAENLGDANAPALNAPAPTAPAAIDGQTLETDANLAATEAADLDKDLKALDTGAGL